MPKIVGEGQNRLIFRWNWPGGSFYPIWLRQRRIKIVYAFDDQLTGTVEMTQTGTELAIPASDDRLDLTYQACAQAGIRYAMSILRNQSDAEEAVQEAFCRLHGWDLNSNETAFRGKFFVTLRNHCIDLIRRRKVRKEVRLAHDLENYRQRSTADGSDVVAAVEDAMNNLPEHWKQVLRLRIHGELSYQEISEITGCSFSQVRTWIYRGRRQLEADLTQRGFIDSNS